MRFTIRILLVACTGIAAVTGASAQDNPGEVIAADCAEIWATRTFQQLNDVQSRILEPRVRSRDSTQSLYNGALEDYETARMAFRVAHRQVSEAIKKAAAEVDDVNLYNLAVEYGIHRLDEKIDADVDAALREKIGGLPLTDMVDIARSNREVDARVQEQQQAEAVMISARGTMLEHKGTLTAIDLLIEGIATCADDQAKYLNTLGDAAFETTDPDNVDGVGGAKNEAIAGNYMIDTVFSGSPTRVSEVWPDIKADIPYSPAGCHDECAGNPNCVAWNYTYDAGAADYPPAQCAIFEHGEIGDLIRSTERAGMSGYGPKSVELLIAAPAE